eukprot:3737246-Prorocentrum_lima.AAC.1
MTSSLVGSEMCIRDRFNARVSPISTPPRPLYRHYSATIHNQFGKNRKAVSYTHLTLPTICSV